MEKKEKAPPWEPISQYKDNELPRNVQCFKELTEAICVKKQPISFPSEKTRVRVPIVVNELSKSTDKLRFNGEKVWYYNGICWSEVTEWELGIFLRNFANRLGWSARY